MIDFTVRPDGGEPYKVTATSRDIWQWERTNRGASFNALMVNMQMVDLYKVAYIASRRQGLFTGTEKEFNETVDIVADESDGEPDPTQPAP